MTTLDQNTLNIFYDHIINTKLDISYYIDLLIHFAELNEIAAIHILIDHYKNINDKENIIKYCKIGDQILDLYSLTILIKILDDKEEKIIYIHKFIDNELIKNKNKRNIAKIGYELNDIKSITYLCNNINIIMKTYYIQSCYSNTKKIKPVLNQLEEKHVAEFLKYNIAGANLNIDIAIDNLVTFYLNNIDEENMTKYLLLSTNYKLYELVAAYYVYQNNNELIMKYYLMAKIFNPKSCIFDERIRNNISYKYTTKLEMYNLLLKLQKCEYTDYWLKEFSNEKEIKIFNNKKRLFENLNNIKQCIICYETKINIDIDCGHELCCDCYCNSKRIKKCHYNCF
jgi:hypothetical protein